MHMADALLSTPVALTAGAAATALIAVAGAKLKESKRENIVPLMGVTGAFIFAAQMINFTIPGTGSSGHIVGGILLAALLGPWAAFLTLTSVLIIQCLVFADGGLLALGCNILNMGALSSLVAYPLIFRPIAGRDKSSGRVIAASIVASVIGLELGACAVTLETMLSGISALPAGQFLALMTSIHLPIGIGEGLATAAILAYVMKAQPSLLYDRHTATPRKKARTAFVWFAVGALILGGCICFFASEYPDGLEWSIQTISGSTELASQTDGLASGAQIVQDGTAILPEYNNVLSGVVGATMVLALVWSLSALLIRRPAVKKVPVDKRKE